MAFGFLGAPDEYIPSELSAIKAVDIHHLCTREDRIENLMALTREEHAFLGENKKYTFFLLCIHELYLQNAGLYYDRQWFVEQKKRYYPEIYV